MQRLHFVDPVRGRGTAVAPATAMQSFTLELNERQFLHPVLALRVR